MIGHYLKLVWNRRRANGLILAEILISFLVLCLVFSVAAYYAASWQRPLGFDWRNRWTLEVLIPTSSESDEKERARSLAHSERLLASILAHPGVVAAAPMANTPYSGSRSSTSVRLADSRTVQYMTTSTTPAGLQTLGLEMVRGRWIEPGDETLPYTAVVVSQNLAERLFGKEDPLGRVIEGYDEKGVRQQHGGIDEQRVIGVFRPYRKTGELAETPFSAYSPQSYTDTERSWSPWSYLIRMAPGTPAAFEESLLRMLQQEQPSWTFQLESVEVERGRYLRGRIQPLLFGAVLAGFLVVMVGMGLMGVLWQNVTRRTQELGLRRALGATPDGVRQQIIGEIVVLTGIALAVGTLLFLQVPLLGMFPYVKVGIYVAATLASVLVIVPFVILCGLYPGWLATRVEPARALQYE